MARPSNRRPLPAAKSWDPPHVTRLLRAMGTAIDGVAILDGAGVAAGSASLQADALDFLGDALNYSISLFVVGMALRYRATAAMLKGLTMGHVRFLDYRNVDLACPARHASKRHYDGHRRAHRPHCKCALFRSPWAHRRGDANMRGLRSPGRVLQQSVGAPRTYTQTFGKGIRNLRTLSPRSPPSNRRRPT
jgi:hypothetical protein